MQFSALDAKISDAMIAAFFSQRAELVKSVG